MLEHDDWLEESDQAIDADPEPEFNPEPSKDDNVVVVEPKIISIGRDRRKRERNMRDLQKEQGKP
jgi:hypothetical protein